MKPKPAPAPAPAAAPAPAPAPSGPGMVDSNKAIWAAESASGNAKKLCGGWRDTAKMLDGARAAQKAGEHAKAIKLANTATEQSDDCVNQMYLEKAQFIIADVEAYGNALDNGQRARLATAKQSWGNREGKRSYDEISSLKGSLGSMFGRYVVRKGDTLSGIAARSDIYGSSRQWRRIYDANRGRISNPDRIMPGWELTIPR